MSYISFYELSRSRNHFRYYIGSETIDGSFQDLKYTYGDLEYQNIFFKVDIEGSEYRILDDLIEIQNRISGIVVEFHECDLHISKITDFVNRLRIPLVHIHINNFGSVIKSNSLPTVMELTFSKYGQARLAREQPHVLDMPNNPLADEVKIVFADE